MCYNQQSNSLFLAWYDFQPVCTVNAQYVLFMFAIYKYWLMRKEILN